MSFILLCALIFVLSATVDAVWVGTTTAVARGQPGAAALWSVLLYLISAVGVVAVVDNLWLLVPGAFGSAAGTFISVRYLREHT